MGPNVPWADSSKIIAFRPVKNVSDEPNGKTLLIVLPCRQSKIASIDPNGP